jgi:hypothetical protein
LELYPFFFSISQWSERDEHRWADFKLTGNIIIHKVSKTQHQNLEFGHTQGEIQRKPAKKYISIQLGMKLREPSILVVN